MFRRGKDERAAAGGGLDRIDLAADRDLADLRAAGRHRVVARAVVHVERPAADVPERLQLALAVDELDVVRFRALEQAS